MTPSELMKVAGAQSPDIFGKVASALYLLERLDKDYFQEALDDISTITEFVTTKLAAVSPQATWTGSLGQAGAQLGANIVGGAAQSMASDIYDVVKRKVTKGSNFKRIIRENPELKDNYDMAQLKKAFNTLHRYAPDFTADPLLGGRLLYTMVAFPENMHTNVLNLLDYRKTLQNVKAQQYSPANLRLESPSHLRQVAHDIAMAQEEGRFDAIPQDRLTKREEATARARAAVQEEYAKKPHLRQEALEAQKTLWRMNPDFMVAPPPRPSEFMTNQGFDAVGYGDAVTAWNRHNAGASSRINAQVNAARNAAGLP